MSETKWVQHISGQGEKYKVYDEALSSWRIRNEIEFDYWLPKSEYRLCDPPEVWEDVTRECEVVIMNGVYLTIIASNGCSISTTSGYRLRKVPVTFMVAGPKDEPGHAFIVERRKA